VEDKWCSGDKALNDMRPRRRQKEIPMRRILTNLALVAVALLALATTTRAADKHGSSNSRGSRSDRDRREHRDDRDRREHREYHDYAFQFGTKFDHGYFFSGREHRHWTERRYFAEYGCECYYCPSTSAWYYWYAPQARYYPVSYFRFARP
jgi:Ni/Co efflux regulator RcnB